MSNSPKNETHNGNHSGLKHTVYIVAAIILAVVFALVAPRAASAMSLGGEIFLNILMMIVVPLVVSSVMSGILGLGDIRKLGKPGLYAVLYYFSTTILAVTIGLVTVNLLRPGNSVTEEQLTSSSASSEHAVEYLEKKEAKEAAEKAADEAEKRRDDAKAKHEQAEAALAKDKDNQELQAKHDKAAEELKTAATALTKANAQLKKYEEDHSLGKAFHKLVLMLFTKNLFKAAVDAELLPLIVFSLVFAGMLTTLGERVDNITRIIDQTNHALMSFVMLIMKVAPLGIFCLVTAKLGAAVAGGGLGDVFRTLGWFIVTVLFGLALHAFVTLPLILWVFTRRNPYKFMLQMSQALLTAFSTSSSSATLPVTMETAVDEAGVSRQSVEFVIPLGATVNMDGTALYEAAAAIFIAQAMVVAGMMDPLTLGQQLTVAVTATLAAIGAAGIPEAGLITMLIVFNAVRLPPEYIALILPVDWFLDRFRTAVNCFGDSVGAAVVDQTFPKSSAPAETVVVPNPVVESA